MDLEFHRVRNRTFTQLAIRGDFGHSPMAVRHVHAEISSLPIALPLSWFD